MKRSIDYYLSNWRQNSNRKPLILRGARQVGKTHAVNRLGVQFDNFVEVNDMDFSPARIVRKIIIIPSLMI